MNNCWHLASTANLNSTYRANPQSMELKCLLSWMLTHHIFDLEPDGPFKVSNCAADIVLGLVHSEKEVIETSLEIIGLPVLLW